MVSPEAADRRALYEQLDEDDHRPERDPGGRAEGSEQVHEGTDQGLLDADTASRCCAAGDTRGTLEWPCPVSSCSGSPAARSARSVQRCARQYCLSWHCPSQLGDASVRARRRRHPGQRRRVAPPRPRRRRRCARDARSAPRATRSSSRMWRSCAKPFQVMPLLASGGFDDARLGRRRARAGLRLARRRARARRDRRVDAARPRTRGGRPRLRPARAAVARGAKIAPRVRRAPDALHNNCSGKHAAMLARAHFAGWPLQGYESDEHPVQAGCARRGRAAGPASRRERSLARSMAAASSCSGSRSRPWRAPTRASRAPPRRGDEIPRASRARCDAPVPVRRHRPLRLAGDRGDRGRVITEDRRRRRARRRDPRPGASASRSKSRTAPPARSSRRAPHASVARRASGRCSPRLAEYARTRIRNTRGEVVGEVFPRCLTDRCSRDRTNRSNRLMRCSIRDDGRHRRRC